jgi:hypothetical protein
MPEDRGSTDIRHRAQAFRLARSQRRRSLRIPKGKTQAPKARTFAPSLLAPGYRGSD